MKRSKYKPDKVFVLVSTYGIIYGIFHTVEETRKAMELLLKTDIIVAPIPIKADHIYMGGLPLF